MFDTRITRLFGIRHPLLVGGMHHLSTSGLVAAAANAGALAFITAHSFDTLAAFRDDLRRCRDLAGGRPFGVNFTLRRRADMNQDVTAWIDIALEEGVRHFESAGSSPQEHVARIHAGGALLMHKCPSVRHALTAERIGVDAVALVGMEEGGHPGANELPTFLNGALALHRLKLPLVLGGGIGCGAQIAALLALGADAVLMGSRFMAATEVQVHQALKERLVAQDENGSMTILRSLGDTWRVMVNDAALQVRRLEEAGVRRHADFGDLILSSRTRERVYRDGRVEDGIVSFGPAGAFADAIEPVAAIVERLMREAAQAADAFARRRTAALAD